MIIRSLRPCPRRIRGVRYLSTSRDPRRKRPGSSVPRPPPSRQPSSAQDGTSPQDGASPPPPPPPPSLSSVLSSTPATENPLLAPVHIPEDPSAILKSTHPATALLTQPSLIVQRQIEMLNLFLGFEQANRYTILSASGEHIGYMAEHDGGFGRAIGRQWFRTHRAFTTNVFDRQGNEVLRFQRPFSWINSNIRVYDPLDPSDNYSKYTSPSTALSTDADPAAARHISPLPLDAMRIIGEAHSEWAPLRRKYNLFLSHNPSLGKPSRETSFTQFARINEPFLSWDFSLRSDSDQLVGSVSRNFAGFGREIFTDTGVYALRMDAAAPQPEGESAVAKIAQGGIGRRYGEVLGGGEEEEAIGMTLDQRAVMLATAVTVDFDYFSRHSHGSGVGFMPFWFWGGGGEAAGGAAAGGAAAGAEGAGAVVGAGEGVGAVVGNAGRAAGGMTGAGEGAIAGAGTMAGYEAMQRGMGRGQEAGGAVPPSQAPVDDASPQQQQVNEYGDPVEPNAFNESQSPQEFGQQQPGGGGEPGQDVWGGGDKDPWQGGGADAGGGGGGGGEGGGGLLQTLWDSFFDS